MRLDDERKRQLGIALNEAEFLGLEVDAERRTGAATFRVLTLPPSGPTPADRRVQMLFTQVGSVAASLREGMPKAPKVIPFELQELLGIVESFGGLPIYGWNFFDLDPAGAADWMSALSLDWSSPAGRRAHSISLFQDGGPRVLDLCVCFEELELRTPSGRPLSVDEFVADGRRWWDGLHAGDPRTKGFGIVSGRPPRA